MRINGERVAEGRLRPGDELQIGNFRYQVCSDPLGPSARPAGAPNHKAGPRTVADDLLSEDAADESSEV